MLPPRAMDIFYGNVTSKSMGIWDSLSRDTNLEYIHIYIDEKKITIQDYIYIIII